MRVDVWSRSGGFKSSVKVYYEEVEGRRVKDFSVIAIENDKAEITLFFQDLAELSGFVQNLWEQVAETEA